MPTVCRPCPDLICDIPSDLAVGNPVFALVPFTFVINCPPGFFCFQNPTTVTVHPPPVKPPPPNPGQPIIIRLQGCLSLITRILPSGSPQSDIDAAIAQVQAEWAAQQAQCNNNNGTDDHPFPPPRPIPIFPLDICGRLPTACVGTPYSAQLFPCGTSVQGAFTWTLISGDLPPGISIFQVNNSRNLFFTGVPTTLGRYTFLIQTTDNFSHIAQRVFTMRVIGFTSPAPPDPQVGVDYNFTFTVDGGTAPYTFTVGSGMLPDGLTLSPDGILSGIPTSPGQVAMFTVCVTDSF